MIPVKPAETQQRQLDGNTSVSLPRMRVLVADDNGTNLIVARSMLERLGQSADTVIDGQEAVEAVLRSHYDLVLMDLSMPQLDGYDATRRIRGLGPAYADLPIIALTAHAAPDTQRCREAGFTGILTKPLLRPQLVETLQAAIGAKQHNLLHFTAPGEVIHSKETAACTIQRQELARRADDLKADIGEEAVADVLEAAVADFGRLLATFSQFGKGGPLAPAALERALHSISGIARTLGCKTLAHDARHLEHRSATLSLGDHELSSLISAIEALRQDLVALSASSRKIKSSAHLEIVQ